MAAVVVTVYYMYGQKWFRRAVLRFRDWGRGIVFGKSRARPRSDVFCRRTVEVSLSAVHHQSFNQLVCTDTG